jgi:hypothetical protein
LLGTQKSSTAEFLAEATLFKLEFCHVPEWDFIRPILFVVASNYECLLSADTGKQPEVVFCFVSGAITR